MEKTDGESYLLKKNPEEMNITEYKSAFYQFLAKPDSITKVYNKTAVIDLHDIYELNGRICSKFGQFKEAGFIIQANVKFADGKTKSFSNWTSFTSHEWYEGESINNIVITWEFNAYFPDLQVPERHTLMVKLSNGLRPEEMLNLVFTGKIEEIEEMDNNLFPIVARVDFVDRILGDELLNIVGDWVKGLQDSPIQKSKIMLHLKKNKAKVSGMINWLTNIIIMFCSVGITSRYILSMEFRKVGDITDVQLVYMMCAIFACVAAWMLGKKLVGSITDTLFERLRMYGENALFNITKGDKNKQARINRREKTSRLVIIGNILLTVILNILCGVLVNCMF